jgi:hypothetical protein
MRASGRVAVARASHRTNATPESDRHSGRYDRLRQAHPEAAVAARIGTERAGEHWVHPPRSMISSRRDPDRSGVFCLSKSIAGGDSSAPVRVLHRRSPGILHANRCSEFWPPLGFWIKLNGIYAVNAICQASRPNRHWKQVMHGKPIPRNPQGYSGNLYPAVITFNS